MPQEWTTEQVFAVLSDRPSLDILKAAYQGRLRFSNHAGKLSKKQFYTKLKRLCNTGLVEKREDAYYRTTTFGSLVYNGHVKTLEDALTNFWQLKSHRYFKDKTGLSCGS